MQQETDSNTSRSLITSYEIPENYKVPDDKLILHHGMLKKKSPMKIAIKRWQERFCRMSSSEFIYYVSPMVSAKML
jgi:hypothetical protein